MGNRMIRVRVRDRSLDPAQAELWVVAETERVGPTTELRGRLTGPCCLYSATVEVAYPLRPFTRRPEGLAGPAARVVIPEPSLWEPECPFLYEGTVELWEDGACVDRAAVRHGLRRMLLGQGGLRVNGRALSLRGRRLAACDDGEAAALRRAGYNLLVAPGDADLSDLADRRGLFVLGRLSGPDEAVLALAGRRAAHPSCLGWLLEPPLGRWAGEPIARLREHGALVGVQFSEPPNVPPPGGVAFVVRPPGAANAASRGAPDLPVLLAGEGPAGPDVFGRLD